MEKEKQIISNIEDILLNVARASNEVSNSDLQGIAMVKAQEIYDMVKEEE